MDVGSGLKGRLSTETPGKTPEPACGLLEEEEDARAATKREPQAKMPLKARTVHVPEACASVKRDLPYMARETYHVATETEAEAY